MLSINKKISLKFILIICLLVVIINKINCKKKSEKCDSCNKIVESIIQNLDKTAKGNFGGGNSDWEYRKLGNYLTSETRFEEILEGICDESECHSTLEEHEDYLFDWFRNKQEKIKNELNSAFCINTLKACCPADKYGDECKSCPFNLNQVCSGNGHCDGSGTRRGSGKCKCNSGYAGDLCDSCKSGYFEEIKNAETVKCSECHLSCKTTCFKSGAAGCVDCKDGWTFNEGKCSDIDECASDSSVCNSDTEFCENSEGSYSCRKCNQACKKCTGTGASQCVECNDGYEKSADECIDINECERDVNICGQHKCENKAGSYECIEASTQQNENSEQQEEDSTEILTEKHEL